MSQARSADPWQAGDMAYALRRYEVALYLGAVQAQIQRDRSLESVSTVSAPTPPSAIATVAAPSSSTDPFACMAIAETSGIPAMGPTYWTVYGMVTGIITEYGTPDEQAAVFSGTATLLQQTDIASRFAADHGFGGWGVLTRQKCGLG